MSHEVESTIKADIEAGRDHFIDHVLVSPRVFCILFMEGKITFAQMQNAIENTKNMTISVDGVPLCGRSFTVKTMPEEAIKKQYNGKLRFATIDANGDVV